MRNRADLPLIEEDACRHTFHCSRSQSSKIMLPICRRVKWTLVYFNASGAMVTGGLTIDGKYYYFDSDGVLDETDYDAVDEPGDETSDDDTEYDYDYDYDLEEY